MSSVEVVKKLLKAIEATDVSEVYLEEEGLRIRIRRGSTAVAAPEVRVMQHHAPASFAPPAPAVEAPAAKPATAERSNNYFPITCPFVGTFYRSAAPGAPPFVEEGQEVQPGTVLCIIEAMKLMNEIESEKHARVAKILVDNGAPVEYGQELMLLELLG